MGKKGGRSARRRPHGKGGNPFTLPKKSVNKTKPTPSSPSKPAATPVAADAEKKVVASPSRTPAVPPAAGAKEGAPVGLSKKQQKRQKVLKYLLEQGRIEQTDADVKNLTRIKPPVVHAFVDCKDEVELRNRFHSQGTAGDCTKYFTASKFRFRYVLASDGTPVTQIIKVGSGLTLNAGKAAVLAPRGREHRGLARRNRL